ncbi:MAG: sulfonate ABC transporter substrate-binding protein [Oscillatoriophycideae cyanobacterium NC_groundwater_1537_Pr4_S-0.65um_50_18]|nr:sulfonate ABC transporter substrate-binding protein [Oscillatoriophycideae cyanobacterium NC_groundwater_1537_Pr4_S-0.65um_50_18]
MSVKSQQVWIFNPLRSLFPKHRLISTLSLLFSVGLGLSLILSACTSPSTSSVTSPSPSLTAKGTVVHIGYQKAATILSALKTRGDLEKALASSGASVEWTEFPAGPPMLEAMNAGSIDFGYTGEAPPIFAQAAGTPVRYVAYDPWSPKAEAIVVPKDSPIQKVADLEGKKLAFAKGSNTNYLAVKVLESSGLKLTDVEVVHLAPADARAAFEGRSIDAWAIWDPYLSVAEEKANARIIRDATGLAPNRGYYLAAQSFIEKNPDALKTVLAEVTKVSDWAKQNPTEVAKFLSPALGIDAVVLEKAEKRRDYGVLPLSEEVIKEQQRVADTFYNIKLIPTQIKVQESVWAGS